MSARYHFPAGLTMVLSLSPNIAGDTQGENSTGSMEALDMEIGGGPDDEWSVLHGVRASHPTHAQEEVHNQA